MKIESRQMQICGSPARKSWDRWKLEGKVEKFDFWGTISRWNFEVVGGTCLLLYTRYILIMSLTRQNTIIGIRIFARK